jgi:phosphocarrier protein
MRFVKCAKKYAAKIQVEKDGKIADAKGMMDLLTLAAGKGDKISITATGADEEAAVTALVALLEE